MTKLYATCRTTTPRLPRAPRRWRHDATLFHFARNVTRTHPFAAHTRARERFATTCFVAAARQACPSAPHALGARHDVGCRTNTIRANAALARTFAVAVAVVTAHTARKKRPRRPLLLRTRVTRHGAGSRIACRTRDLAAGTRARLVFRAFATSHCTERYVLPIRPRLGQARSARNKLYIGPGTAVDAARACVRLLLLTSAAKKTTG
jgi:hypothetical protein